MGLRDTNKIARQTRILQAATRLFRQKGYHAAKIEDIAAVAEASIGTFYNYYKNKGDILVAIVAMEVNEVLAAVAKIVQHPPRNGLVAINTLVETYVDHSLHYLTKDMWRSAMAITTAEPESPFGRKYLALDAAFTRVLIMHSWTNLFLAIVCWGIARGIVLAIRGRHG